jgi:hypothetical protein
LKSKEPKQPKQPKERKKSEAKPRKGKSVVAAAVEAAAAPTAHPSNGQIDPSTNGAGDPLVVAIEMVGAEVNPTDEMIRVRAYEMFTQRGGEHGYHLDDWLAAERELKSRYRSA